MMQENVTPSPSSSSSLGPPKVSRKQKSLGLLCEKFMARFPESVPEGEKCEIPLDDLAKQMATERRRIYDIVNVLEAVQMMTKVSFSKLGLPSHSMEIDEIFLPLRYYVKSISANRKYEK